jgi:tRNA modification GTPase
MVMRALHGADGPIDRTLVAWFPGPSTATGEDIAEFHLHGGAAVINGLIEAVLTLAGTRLAGPGEFTRRAFDNRRLDMTQVEGLADLLAAETASQRHQALSLANGALGRFAETWRERCLTLLAEAEAGLDFAEDEADVAARLDLAASDALSGMADELDQLVHDSARAERIRDGLTIVVSGPPNVGKSSLVNALAMRDVSIVTPLPGTTRDPIEVPLDLGGVAAVLIDTAGLRETSDPVEAEGIARARARAAAADLIMQVTDDPATVAEAAALLVLNKCDLHGQPAPVGHIAVSALTGDGIAALRTMLVDVASSLVRMGEPGLLAHARHKEAFADAAGWLREASVAPLPEMRAEGLRLASRAFGRVAGRVEIDDVLDQIFLRFCIGK